MFNCLVLLQYGYSLWALVSLNFLCRQAKGLIEFQKKESFSPPLCLGESRIEPLLAFSNRELYLMLKILASCQRPSPCSQCSKCKS